ncbi:hypothetical protein ACEPAF_851 [Sanghuangporus sanghuang]
MANTCSEQRSLASSYSMASPIFDIPEFPSLRRVIPLPKRRRTIDTPLLSHVPVDAQVAQARGSSGDIQTTPDELANTLSTSMALTNSYYVPLFHGAADLRKDDDIDTRHVNPAEVLTRMNSQNNGYATTEAREETDREDGSYADHLTQPGNTKKRKVPVAAHARGGDDTAPEGGEETADDALPVDRGVAEVVNVPPPVPPPLVIPPKKGKLSRATQAGLQLKEILKSRKRQFADVLSALSHNDSYALDHALSSTHPFGRRAEGQLVHLSRRPQRRKARAISAATRKLLSVPSISENVRVPESSFAFICDSPTSERVRALTEEVAHLQRQFDAEFARQAAKAAEAARQTALMVSQMQKTRHNERLQARARIAGQLAGSNGDTTQKNSENMVTTSKSKSKKKKRSALANASNPHHLRNYVPSRLPNSGPLNSTQTTINLQNYLGPPPMRFLSAELAPRRRPSGVPPPTASLTNPEDEWICPFCEYSLFYGDELSYRRAIRQRKKILSRRRRALERAAAAAAGRKKGIATPTKDATAGDDLTDGYDVSSPEVQATSMYNGLREEQDRDRDKRRGDRGML